MKNKIILGLVLLCVMACTVLVFHLIFDEHTKLFYINVITTCFAEVILLANIPLLSSEKLLTFKNAASSTILDVYAVVLFLWTVVYSAFIEDESGYKTLYIGMLRAWRKLYAKRRRELAANRSIQESISAVFEQLLPGYSRDSLSVQF